MRTNLIKTMIIVFLGYLVSALGLSAMPFLGNLTFFWPAAALQTVGAMLFQGWGVVAAVIFPFLSDLTLHGEINLYYIPANLIQSLLPIVFAKTFNIRLDLPSKRDVVYYCLFCAFVSHLSGALVGLGLRYAFGDLHDASMFLPGVLTWTIGNVPAAILFGIPLLKILTPSLKEYRLISDTFW